MAKRDDSRERIDEEVSTAAMFSVYDGVILKPLPYRAQLSGDG